MLLFSVVIPLYNKANYIERAIYSVFSQTIKDYEIIIIDDGSTDGGAVIVENIRDPRIRLIRQVNLGVSAARNRGIEEAKSELITFLDADDAWTQEFLSTILRLRKNFPNAGIYATDYISVNDKGIVKKSKYKTIPCAPWEGIISNYFKSLAKGEYVFSSSSICIPKIIFAQVGNFVLGESRGEDLDMWSRIALKYPIAFSTHKGALYYLNAKNRADSVMYEPKREIFLIRASQRLIENNDLSKNCTVYIKEIINQHQILLASMFILQGKRSEAKQLLKECKTRHALIKIWWLFLAYIPYRVIHYYLSFKKLLIEIIRKEPRLLNNHDFILRNNKIC